MPAKCLMRGKKVKEILELDTSKFQVVAFLPFGYRLNEQSEQLRLPFDEVVEFISDYPTNPIPKLLKEREEVRCE